MTEPEPRPDLRALLLEYLEAWNSHDVDRVLERLTDDIVWRRPGLSRPLRGKTEAGRDIAGFFTAFPDLRFAPEDLDVFQHENPDRAVGLWTAHGTLTGRLEPGFEPTGRSAVITGCTFYRLRHDLVSDTRIVYDALDLLQQLGLLPTDGSPGFKVLLEAQNLTQRAKAALHR